MSSRLIRLGLPAVLGAVLASAIASAQDRKPNQPTPAHTVAVFNPIEGRTVVLTAKPDEASVEAGETVCEFDPADLRDRLASQEIVVHGAQAESASNQDRSRGRLPGAAGVQGWNLQAAARNRCW